MLTTALFKWNIELINDNPSFEVYQPNKTNGDQ